jgi:hypothetical protein
MTDQDEMRKISLETYTVMKNIEKIKEFMFADLDKTIELAHSGKGAPNFMLALVLCAYTEFWGKLMLGVKTDKNQESFDAFFRKLGRKYGDLLDKHRHIYSKFRSELVHEYRIKGSSKIVTEGGDCGIAYNDKTGIPTFYIRRYLEDFKFAVNNYISELRTDLDKFNKAKEALENKAQLL